MLKKVLCTESLVAKRVQTRPLPMDFIGVAQQIDNVFLRSSNSKSNLKVGILTRKLFQASSIWASVTGFPIFPRITSRNSALVINPFHISGRNPAGDRGPT